MKTKESVSVLPVNLQQGFFLNDNQNVVAAYHHHKKIVYFKVPASHGSFNIPKEFFDYKMINGHTDSFSISMWTSNGQKEL